MLHGYTQSGDLFHAKTRALERHLQKSLNSVYSDVSLTYPTGPIRLNPGDVPGFTPSGENSAPEETEAFGWWRRSNTSDPPEYLGFETGLATIADMLEKSGPFDGVIGFSQGAAGAAMVASLLEPNRQTAFSSFSSEGQLGIPYPDSFKKLNHQPLKFAIAYSGFRAPGSRYRGFYENPSIQTPMLHFLGTLDSVVEESRPKALIEACEKGNGGEVVWHPGGHFLPSQRLYLDAVVKFVTQCMGDGGVEGKKEEERAEDMDVPF